MRKTFIGALLLTSLASVTAAAQLGSYNPPPGPQGTFAIRNAHIFPVSGPEITNGTVVISGGKIQAVGANGQIAAAVLTRDDGSYRASNLAVGTYR